ncbi:ATP-binding protein [Pseudomonas fluorescens]|uniref:ATP-binding protein n=1 Tax=Pseudomonas fluorescens TaxID=294 RepID=UPI00177B32D8|nr:ATP-binding protein [Pseudomonas fluorescens]
MDQKDFLEALLHGAPCPIAFRDREGVLKMANPAYYDFFKVKEEQMLGKTFRQARLADSVFVAEHERITGQALADGKPFFGEVTLVLNQQPSRLYYWAIPFGRGKSGMRGIVGGWFDLTEREKLVHALHNAKDLAESESRSKSEFLAVMSHELRTPISALIGVLELAQQSSKAGIVPSELITIARQSAQGLVALIGEVLDLSKIESGKLELRLSRCVPYKAVSEVVLGFQSLATLKKLDLSFEGEGQELEVEADCVRLKQVVSNLVSNAIKFTQEGGVKVTLAVKAGEGRRIDFFLQVIDTGVGIEKSRESELFKPYTQIQACSSGPMQGTGLGLSISRQLARLMGGDLSYEGNGSAGACFTFRFTACQLHAPSTLTAAPATQMRPDPPSLRILLVEDHELSRMVLTRQLSHLGMQVTCASNGAEALEIWSAGVFDCVMTDCSMPQMSGDQLAKAIRVREQSTHAAPVYILGLTANVQPQEIPRCKAAGMDDCLFKPVALNELACRLSDLRRPLQCRLARQEVFCRRRVDEITSENPRLAHRLLATVTRTCREDLAEMQALYTNEDAAGMARLSHKVRGAARMIDAHDLEKVCEQLGECCYQYPVSPRWAELYHGFVRQQRALIAAVEKDCQRLS